jgi:transcriptional regulator with XRE-family HTH domain
MIKVGETIRELRERQQLSQKELATRSSLTASFLSLVENNKRDPSFTVLRRIADALRVPEEAIVWHAVAIPGNLKKRERALCEAAKLIVQRIMEDSTREGIAKGARKERKRNNEK